MVQHSVVEHPHTTEHHHHCRTGRKEKIEIGNTDIAIVKTRQCYIYIFRVMLKTVLEIFHGV